MKKILIVATVQSHVAQFHQPFINWLHEQGCHVDVAARNNLALKKSLTLDTPDNIYDIPFERSPFKLKNFKAYKELKKLINSGGYDIVHCHTPVGSILARLAANRKRKKGELKVIYSAHGFHFFEGCPRKNWLVYYPVEKILSKSTDVLVTTNKMDHKLALEKFYAKRIEYVPGVGADLSRFENANVDCDIKEELNIQKSSKMVMSVGELNENKNHRVIIRALAYLNDENIHYIIVGNGPLDGKLKALANELGLGNRVHLLGYRRDIPALLKSADLFAFPSRREGLGLASIEAMATGVPLVTSNRHGINDYSEHGKTGFKYHPDDYKGFAEGIKTILYDETLKRTMGEYNKTRAQDFNLSASIGALGKIYKEIFEEIGK